MFGGALRVVIGDLVALSARGSLRDTLRRVGVGGFVSREYVFASGIRVENECWCSCTHDGHKGREEAERRDGKMHFRNGFKALEIYWKVRQYAFTRYDGDVSDEWGEGDYGQLIATA